MWSETHARTDAERAATGLTLEDLIAMQPRHVRGTLAPGQRIPGGERTGRGRAQSLEFDGLSPYEPGDDVRWIDWRATARTGRAIVRRFAAQSHRARLIVVDLSPALYFGTADRLMAKTAALVAARLAWESVLLQEPVEILAPGMEHRRPRRGRRHVLGLLDGLQRSYAACERDAPAWDVAAALGDGAAQLARGDEVCLIGEFAEPGADFRSISRTLSEIRTLRAIVLEDPLARRPVPGAPFPTRDPDGQRHVLRIEAVRGAHMQSVGEDLRAERRRILQDLGWRVGDALAMLPRWVRA